LPIVTKKVMWTILLDIDGTLLTTNGAGLESIRLAIGDLYGIDLEIPRIAVHGRTDVGILHDLLQDVDIPWQSDLSQLFEVYCKYLKVNLGRFQGRVMPGVVEFLTALQWRNDVAMGLLTGNCQGAAYLKMEHFSLDHFVDGFGGYGDRSPDRNQVALLARKSAAAHLQARFDPNRVWVIGDTVADVQCAQAIGARVLAVATGGTRIDELERLQPDICVSDLSATDQIISLLLE
jgi:phosphoglycolate phosphatase-like HAD superfamily hydrolase